MRDYKNYPAKRSNSPHKPLLLNLLSFAIVTFALGYFMSRIFEWLCQ